MLGYISPDKRVLKDHPLRRIWIIIRSDFRFRPATRMRPFEAGDVLCQSQPRYLGVLKSGTSLLAHISSIDVNVLEAEGWRKAWGMPFSVCEVVV